MELQSKLATQRRATPFGQNVPFDVFHLKLRRNLTDATAAMPFGRPQYMRRTTLLIGLCVYVCSNGSYELLQGSSGSCGYVYVPLEAVRCTPAVHIQYVS